MRLFWPTSALFVALGITVAQAQSGDRQEAEVLAPGAPWWGATPRLVAEPEKMPRILNDTREYCDVLRQDIARIRAKRGEIPTEPAMLAREGERMCQMGHFRPGIYRLRSALMMLRPGQ